MTLSVKNPVKHTFDKSHFRFLTDAELDTYSRQDTCDKDAKDLEAERFREHTRNVNGMFVDKANRLETNIARKSEDLTTTYTRYIRECAGDEAAALDMLLYTHPQLRAELNQERKEAPINYLRMAYDAGKSEFRHYVNNDPHLSAQLGLDSMIRAATTSTAAPGQGNTLQTTVAQSIMYRVDEFSEVLNKVNKINLPYGNYDATKFNKYGVAGYITEGAATPDNTADLENNPDGINKVSYEAKQFGISFRTTWLSTKRISASVIAQQMRFTEQNIGRGEAYQILSGPGTGSNDSGVGVVGTAVPEGNNILDTLINACSFLESVNAKNMHIFMEAKAYGEFAKVSTINTPYQNTIDVKNKRIYDKPVTVVSNTVLPVASNVSKVIVGDFDHYIRFTNGSMEVKKAMHQDKAGDIVHYLMARDGGAVFADSFAHFNVNVD